MVAALVIVLAFFGPLLVLLAIRGIRYLGATAKRQRFVEDLVSAAVADDMAMLEMSMKQGAVNYATAQGDTALHYAYYAGEQNAIDNLRAYGADQNLRNNEGLTPRDMADLAATEDLLRRGARYLRPDGVWLAPDIGLRVYQRLRESPSLIYNPAVVRQVFEPDRRQQLLILAIKVGKSGSQEKLAEALYAFGDKAMAEDYLNAGSPYLQQGAQTWARRHNYKIFRTPGAVNTIWGHRRTRRSWRRTEWCSCDPTRHIRTSHAEPATRSARHRDGIPPAHYGFQRWRRRVPLPETGNVPDGTRGLIVRPS